MSYHFEAIRVLLMSGLAFFVALILTPLVIRALRTYRIGKNIRSYLTPLHGGKAGTPTMGGIVIWGTVLGLAAVLWIIGNMLGGYWENLNFIDRGETYLPIAAMLIAGIIGFIDDIFGVLKIGTNGGGLHVRHKLIIYTIIAAVGAWWFYVKLDWTTLFIPFIGNVEIGWWYVPIFMFIITATAFSANETDGLDGLLGGVSLFAFGALTVVAFSLGYFDLAVFSGVVVGALLSFLWYNIHPAQVFMGDTGSMSLGITLGVIAMLTNTALFLPLFGFILVIESLSVIIQISSVKVFRKKVFLFTPIHHHFEKLGWPEPQITMRFWIISAVCSGIGLVLFFLTRIL